MEKVIFALLMVLGGHLYSQTDNVGSGRAITLDGIDDYVIIGNYKNINLPFSVSAWIFLNPGATGAHPIFVTNDNNPTYRGFWFSITPSSLSCEFGDGTGGNNPAFRRGKSAPVNNVLGRWVHVCVVMSSTTNISLYLNGIDVGGGFTGDSGLPMASSDVGDTGKIGYFLSNGVKYYFKGSIDEVRLWNRALTATEIQQTMCKKLVGDETGLAGYWNFNETTGTTATDSSPAVKNGTFVGGVTRGFSGAPIGDDSKYLYSPNWLSTTVSMTDGSDKITASNIQGNPEGVHIYEVKAIPSQTIGLDATAVSQPYFGIFIASLDNNNLFDATYSNASACKMFSRFDNSISSWANVANPIVNVLQRTEAVRSSTSGPSINFDLGPDRIVCDQPSTTLITNVADPQASFLWSTGEATSTINVSKTGEYSLKVTGACGSRVDSILVLFQSAPQFSLGNDSTFCTLTSIKLNPMSNPGAYVFKWQDGSAASSFTALDFGKYWVTIRNQCGSKTDTVSYTKARSINFDLGPAKIVCDQTSMLLTTGITDPNVTYQWSDGQTTSSINVKKSGLYWAKAFAPCVTKDSIQITFLNSPPPISLGEDKVLCEFKPLTFAPISNASEYQMTWQDNSHAPTFVATDFGKYSVVAKNDCGSSSATVTFSKYKAEGKPIPNVITPNGDDLNQYFKVDEVLKGSVSVQILNRWGTEVYRSSPYQNDWDGAELHPGVYYVVVSGPCISEIRDWITIIH